MGIHQASSTTATDSGTKRADNRKTANGILFVLMTDADCRMCLNAMVHIKPNGKDISGGLKRVFGAEFLLQPRNKPMQLAD